MQQCMGYPFIPGNDLTILEQLFFGVSTICASSNTTRHQLIIVNGDVGIMYRRSDRIDVSRLFD